MVKYREILRLHACGVSQRNIAFSCGCSKNTVKAVLIRAQAKGLFWPLPEETNDIVIKQKLYPPKIADSSKREPDYEHLNNELKKRNVTLMLLWNEYCADTLERGGEPYQYSAFCHRYRNWAKADGIVMHIDRKPAEQIQVDWVGTTMEVCDPDTGELNKVYVFVASLPYSGYMYAEGFYRMDAEAWITAHVHTFSFFGGTTPILVPDNLKTGIIKNTATELVINDDYRHMAEYYGCAVVPTRVRRPKDKGNVEMSVGLVSKQAIAALRDRAFLSLEELNDALRDKVAAINDRSFQKKEGSRTSVYLGQEKEALVPLPTRPYEITLRKRVTVQFNYHVAFEGTYYSVPFSYVKREVELVITKTAVSVMADGKRIAMHRRSCQPRGAYTTNPDHMPQAHRDYAEWDGDRFRKWAAQIGPSTSEVIDVILKSHVVEQQSFRSCHGVLALAKRHSDALLENACAKALAYSSRPSYKSVKNIIGNLVSEQAEDSKNEHAYLRGPKYYETLEGE